MTDRNGQTTPADSSSPSFTLTTHEIILSAVIPLYGAVVGLIALSSGYSRKGRIILALSTANLIIISGAIEHLFL